MAKKDEVTAIAEAPAQPKPKAPIDQRPASSKPRVASLPKATRPSPMMLPDLFGGVQELMDATSLGKTMYADTVMALTLACGDINEIADAEDSIVDAHNKAMAAGTAQTQIQMVDGRPRAIPHRLEELADVADSRLAKALESHEKRIRKHAGFMVALMEQMDDALSVTPASA